MDVARVPESDGYGNKRLPNLPTSYGAGFRFEAQAQILAVQGGLC